MKLWIDDVRPAPEGYIWIKSVNKAKEFIILQLAGWILLKKEPQFPIDLIDMDHDAGEYAKDGGDYIEILKCFEKTKTPCPAIRIHSMNPVGVENIRRIIQRNGWEEIK